METEEHFFACGLELQDRILVTIQAADEELAQPKLQRKAVDRVLNF